jgi:hypothetical protein
MIDKSIRQHYQDGEKVGPFRKGMETIMPKVKEKFFPQDETGLDERQLLKNVAGSAVKNIATRKLAAQLGGTGILSSLGPIGMIIAMMLARKGIGKGQEYLTQKLGEGKGGALQAFQAGFGSPQEGRELRVLESRRANMLQRKEEDRDYSERNLNIVTRAIAEAKGLDINNPNEMKNIDKPIEQIQIEKSITEAPQIIPEEPEVKSPFAKVIPKTPDIISPHLGEDEITSLKPYIAPIAGGGADVWDLPATVKETSPLTTDFAFEDIKRAEQERQAAANRAANRAAEEKAAANRVMQETIAKAEREAAAARATISVPVPAHISGGGGGGNGGGGGSTGTGAGGMGAPGGGGYGPWRAKGGRVDKALGGRVRDI